MKKECLDCAPLPRSHFEKYLESIISHLLPNPSSGLIYKTQGLFIRLLMGIGLIKVRPYESTPAIYMRSSIFIEEGIKRGYKFYTLFNALGRPINMFYLERGGRKYLFEGLPRAEFIKGADGGFIDDKATVKKLLTKMGVPTPQGKCFSILKYWRALNYGKKLGFPLVIKPRSGSTSHHVRINIQDENALKDALKSVFRYEPYAIVERYIPNTRVYRATVIDGKHIAVVERRPANVIGDGKHTVAQLIDIKNEDPQRIKAGEVNGTFYKVVIDKKTEELLKKQRYAFASIPPQEKIVYLQEKVLLDFGADIIEVTKKVHKDNLELFRRVAQKFKAKLIGIDFIAPDISKSWKEQNSAIIELNSLPFVDMHHHPIKGEPVNVAGYICNMVEKYY